MLRIRIPKVFHCVSEECDEFSFDENQEYCSQCLNARMSKEVTPATLPAKPKVIHCAPLGRYLTAWGKID